jgi:HK97 family phage major capsid protein
MVDAPNLTPRVKFILSKPLSLMPSQKTAATAVSTDDFDAFTATSQSFLDSVGVYSAFLRIAADKNFVQVPLRTTIRVLTSGPTAAVVGEDVPDPVMHVTADIDAIEPVKVMSHLAVADDLLRLGGSNVDTMIGNSLRRAVGKAADTQFLQVISNGLGSNASTGLSASEFLDDLKLALQTLVIGADAKLYLILPQLAAKRLALQHDGDGLMVFPQLTPSGGVISGIRVLTSDATGTSAYLIDSNQ